MDEKSIPTYLLFIHPLDLRELRRDIWEDDPVPAKIIINKRSSNIGIAYRGNHIREFDKKSYLIKFVKQSTFQKYKELHFNAEYLDTSLIRSKLSFDFFEDIGLKVPATKHVFLKINGKNSGIYLEIESVDQLFFQKRNIPVKAIFYAINSDADFSLFSHYYKESKRDLLDGYERKYGSRKEDLFLAEFIHKINTVSERDFPKEIIKYVNVDMILRWLAGIVCIQNFDGFHQNYSLYLNAETKLFEISPWDLEATWGRDCNGDIMEYDYTPIYGDNTNALIVKLLEHEPFRKKYKAILEEILQTTFKPQFLYPKISSYADILKPYIIQDPYISNTIKEYEQEIDLIQEFIRDRHRYLTKHLNNL
jgi:spore coat protein H